MNVINHIPGCHGALGCRCAGYRGWNPQLFSRSKDVEALRRVERHLPKGSTICKEIESRVDEANLVPLMEHVFTLLIDAAVHAGWDSDDGVELRTLAANLSDEIG